MPADSIVLLGNSGAGKDTTYAALDVANPTKYYNAKFALLSKTITAKVFNLEVRELEDKELRAKPSKTYAGLSAIDLLTVLYKGITPSLEQAHVHFLLSIIPDGKIPVFTDIRREHELMAVLKNYSHTVIIKLESDTAPEGENDGDISSLYPDYIIERDTQHPYTPEMIAALVEKLANEF